MLKLLRNIVPLCVIAAFLCLPMALFAQLSKVHYIPPISVTTQISNSEPEDQFIYISTPSISPITVVIKPIGAPRTDYIYKTISNITPAYFDVRNNQTIGMWNTQLVIPESLGADILNDKGYIIEAEKPIYVSVRLQSQAQSGAVVSKGGAALSNSFLFGGFVNVSPIQVPYNSFFSVMAIEDDTEVTVEFPKGVALSNYRGSYPVSFKLEKNESFVGILEAVNEPNNINGLIGGKLTSTKDVAVISGSTTGTNGPGSGHDYGIDQLVGTENAGEEFIFIRGESPKTVRGNPYYSIENVVLVPLVAGTTYVANNGPVTPITGDYAIIEGDAYNNNDNMYVVTSGPVMAFQVIGGVPNNQNNPEPNQGMFVVPPLNCTAKGEINNIPFINEIGPANIQNGGIGIVAEAGNDVFLNGSLLNGAQSTENPNYVTYRISGLAQNLYDVNSTGELYVSYFTYRGSSTSGGFYSGFQSAPEFVFDVDLLALGPCLQNNLVLNASGVSGLDSFEWWYNPDAEENPAKWQKIPSTANINSLTPSQIGWYQLRGVFFCGSISNTLVSNPVYIGNCPEDNDNDGIPDNLDLDEDNDGVLDNEESGGDFVFNLSDPYNPGVPATTNKSVSLPSGYSVNSVVSLSSGSSIVGGNTGSITITIPASASAENNYTLNFRQPSNIQVSFLDASSRVDNEIIKIQTSDTNKTISLINIENDFFVDTDYDGGFESGVAYYTNNSIIGKFNPSVSGASDITVVGSEISDITVSHKLNNLTDSGKLTFLISFFDLPQNTDSSLTGGDSVADYLDNDSDGDGCFDVIEAGYEDMDNDGLAGVSPIFYDPSSPTSSADERGRVVYSGYDYTQAVRDFNNNGVFDFQEPGPIPEFSLEPVATSISEGEVATFTVAFNNANTIQWLMDGVPISNDAIFNISSDGTTLNINTSDTSLDGKEFSVLISSDLYLCTNASIKAPLSVLAIPPIPVLDRVYSFCYSGLPGDEKIVLDLKNAIGRSDINIYNDELGGGVLNDIDLLVDGEDYYVTAVNSSGGESVIRSLTNIVIASPEIVMSTTTGAICLGDSVTLTVKGVPQTVTEFEDNLDSTFEKITSYGGSHYFLKKDPMPWTSAKSLIKSLGSGASMYVINSKSEETEIYNKLLSMGYAGPDSTGSDGNHFWLGLRQIDALKNGAVDQGWVWLDGRLLTPLDENWNTTTANEPNDYSCGTCPSFVEDGGEDFAQFDFSPGGIDWNDMSDNGGGGNSWPIFEFEGVSEVKWHKKELGGTKTLLAGLTSNSIVEMPLVTTEYFYEITVNGVLCEDSITINVNDLPTMIPANDFPPECDNNLDGDSTNMNEADFDLIQKRKEILLSVVDRNVFFYESNTSALADSIATATLYTNTANPQTLFYRVVNTNTGCVSNGSGNFDLIVEDLPPEINIDDYHDCDDDSVGNDKDGEHTFDLTQRTGQIFAALGGTASEFGVTYYASLANAKNDFSPITTYTTLPADGSEKEVFIRIEDNATGCVRYDNSFKVVVDKLPTALISTIEIEQCESDGQIKYNLNSLVGRYSANYANEVFEFYLDAALTTPVLDDENFVVPIGITTQDVYIKIIDNNSLCVRFDDVFTAGGPREPLRISFTVGTNNVPAGFTPLTFYDCVDESSGSPVTGTFETSIFNDIRASLLAADPDYNMPTVEMNFYKSELDAVFQRNAIDVTQPLIVNPPLKTQEIWAGIKDIGVKIECLGHIKVADFILAPYPTFNLPSTQVFCTNLGTDLISITNQGSAYTYAWTIDGVPFAQTTADISIASGGSYEVVATNTLTGCETTKTIVVIESEFPLFDLSDLTVFDLTGDGGNRIEVLTGIGALGIGDYEFSLDGGPFQDSPVFEDVPPGIHQVSVRDKNGCGAKSVAASVIGYPLYFTPNGNGQDDNWQVLGVNGVFQSQSLIYVFDRHGRLLAQISTDGPGWDGTYNGTPMPADDYWFRVGLEDGRTFTGHFSLIR
jgi:gliding motility-associated-like protein